MEPRPREDVARLFLALWPDAALQVRLARHRDAWHWSPQASVVRTDQLHLTLHFMGNVSRARLHGLGLALDVAFDPFDLTLERPELWPGGIAVLCPQLAPAGLLRLRACLGEALQSQGLPLDPRAFRPHVTLARRAAGAVPPEAPQALGWPVRGYALVESSAGAGYAVLRHFRSQ